MKEVVKKEVLKLLEVGIIYPIFDSKWDGHVQVVPKKWGMTVVKNERETKWQLEWSQDGECIYTIGSLTKILVRITSHSHSLIKCLSV